MVKNITLAVLTVGVASSLFLGITNKQSVEFLADRPAPVQVRETVGAITSPNIPSTYLSWNGVTLNHRRTDTLTAATTTPCALQSPTEATSTLVYASVRLTTSSTTATRVVLAKSTSFNATTTELAARDVAANNQLTLVATTSPSTMDNLVFAPGQYLVMGIQGAGGTAGLAPVGVCTARFISTN